MPDSIGLKACYYNSNDYIIREDLEKNLFQAFIDIARINHLQSNYDEALKS